MAILVQRPPAPERKVNSKDDFELCYLRHQYLRRASYNPTEEEMRPYKKIVEHQARNTYFTYKNLFCLVGLESDDVINIAMVHLTSFLGLFSIACKTEDKYNEIWDKIKEYNHGVIPDSQDFLNKDKANFTIFIKQRMEDVVRVCRQKARNIKGLPTEEFLVFYGPRRPRMDLRKLATDWQKYGFRKMDIAVFKTVKKRLKRKPRGSIFKYGENYYVTVPLEQKVISLFDFSGAGMDPHDSLHNMSPEQVLSRLQEEEHWENKKVQFHAQDESTKIDMLQNFIQVHRNKDAYRDELKAARKLLRSLGE